MTKNKTQTTIDQITTGCMWLLFGFITIIVAVAALTIAIKMFMLITGMGS